MAVAIAAGALVLMRGDGEIGGRELVALGDSYSAGVGLGPVTRRDCDRDDGAYGPRAAVLVSDAIEIDDVDLVACSGAVSAELLQPQTIRIRGDDVIALPQLDAVARTTDIVTMTIGGNDADFAGKVITCLVGACGERLLEIDPSSPDDPGLTWEGLGERLVDRYVDIRRTMDPDGHLFVLSYPVPFELEGATQPCEGFDLLEMEAANALATRLGDVIDAAADEANERLADDDLDGNVVFVDWRAGERVDDGYTAPSGAEFDTIDSPHGICSSEPYLNGFDASTLVSGDLTNNFHPNAAGYGFAADALAEAIEDALVDGA